MLRFGEIGLFLAPFAVYVAWRLMARRAGPGMVAAMIAAVALMGAAVIWFGLDRSEPAHGRYLPARIEAGHIVAGEVVPGARPAP